ncbi:MAG: sigma-70 family RNA polymerase sigma factor [Pirellulales bacterium]|nr:sigma-70 family RNA polymerase sigma factor [Pirellulales bacterium]
MSLRQSGLQPETAEDSRSVPSLDGPPKSREKTHRELLKADAALAKRCVAGEVAAWEELYSQCHDPLLFSIEVMLGPGNADKNLVDELAARVWYTLIKDDAKLLSKYDYRRGAQLITFMMPVAKSELSRYFRDEKRREKRERIALAGKTPHDTSHPDMSLAEFLPTLTRREREFYDDNLLGYPVNGSNSATGTFSLANARQLKHRIRTKLLKFLGYEL